MRRLLLPAAGLAVVSLALAGCSSPAEPTPTTEPSRTTASPSAAPARGVTRTVTLPTGEVTVDVGPVRVDGEHAVLPLRVTVAGDAHPDIEFVPQFEFSSDKWSGVGRVRALDVETGEVLLVGLDDEGAFGEYHGGVDRLGPGETAELEVLIAPPTGERTDVLLPVFGLLPDVPVASGPVPSPEAVDLDGAVRFPRLPTDALMTAYDSTWSARAVGGSVTVTLMSDALFPADGSTLTDAGAAVLAQVAARIAASAAGGEVTVVGHTDDKAPDADGLSTRRAQTVAEGLRGPLGPSFVLASDGRGTGEPVAEGRTVEDRAVNRRFEITYPVTSPEAFLAAGGATVPAADVPVAAGTDAVEFTVDDTVSTARVVSVQRAGRYLVGELEVARVSGDDGRVERLLSPVRPDHRYRDMRTDHLRWGAVDVTLLGAAGRVHPAEFLVPGEDGLREVLGDVRLDTEQQEGDTMPVTVVWPDVGGATVDVEVPGRFRITGVPVEDRVSP